MTSNYQNRIDTTMVHNVAPGFDVKIEHFLYLNRMETEKVTLRHITEDQGNTMEKVWLACGMSVNLSYERMLHHCSGEYAPAYS